ncbi:MAG: hypothetical protein ABIH79_00770 [archaeon]
MVKQTGFLKKMHNFFGTSSSESQEDYFKFQIQLIEMAKERILIYGYDAPFMDRVETVKALGDATKRVNISAIVSRSYGRIPLEKLAENIDNIEILRTDEELSRGYIVYGKIGVNYWNSKRKTSYIPEINEGVIHRVSVANSYLGSFDEYLFDKAHAKKLDIKLRDFIFTST